MLYRQRAASAAEPNLRDAYEQLADAYDAMANWHDIAEGVQHVVDQLEQRKGGLSGQPQC